MPKEYRNNYENLMTEEDYDYIRNNYETQTPKEIAKYLNKGVSTIYVAMKKIGVKKWRATGIEWTDEEIEFLKENYNKMTIPQMSIKLNRSIASIQGKMQKTGLIKNKNNANWTQEEIQYLKDNIDIKNYEEISKVINRSLNSIRNKAYELKLTKRGNGTKLRLEQINFIIANYDKYTDNQLAIKFDVSETAIRNVRKKYNIKKTGNEVSGPTSIELFVKEFLDENNIPYIFNEMLGEYKPDFQILNTKILIEVNGDYYHCNPMVYENGPKDEVQIKHVLRDYYKKCYYTYKGYTILEIWEKDILESPEKVKAIIKSAVYGQVSQKTIDD